MACPFKEPTPISNSELGDVYFALNFYSDTSTRTFRQPNDSRIQSQGWNHNSYMYMCICMSVNKCFLLTWVMALDSETLVKSHESCEESWFESSNIAMTEVSLNWVMTSFKKVLTLVSLPLCRQAQWKMILICWFHLWYLTTTWSASSSDRIVVGYSKRPHAVAAR